MLTRKVIFHPLTVLAASLGAAAVVSLMVIALYEGEQRFFLLYYFVPIGIPFVAFLLDRLERYATFRPSQWVMDAVMVVLSLLRATYPIPLISGHALFLSYALFSTRSWVARLTAFIVLVEVSYLKAVVWHDITLVGGIILGCTASLLFRKLQRESIAA